MCVHRRSEKQLNTKYQNTELYEENHQSFFLSVSNVEIKIESNITSIRW